MWCGGRTVSFGGCYTYQRTTYQMLSTIQICLMIISKEYSASPVLSLRDSLVEGASRIFMWKFLLLVLLFASVSSGALVTSYIYCVMDAILVDGDGIQRGEIFRNGPTVFNRSFKHGLYVRRAPGVSCSGRRLTNSYWPGWKVGVTRANLSK